MWGIAPQLDQSEAVNRLDPSMAWLIHLRRGTLLIHGARAALPSLARSQTTLGVWLRNLLARRHRNTVVVALANKLARIAWMILRREVTFQANRATAMAA
ncbi:hypothetical protein LCM4577_32355 [Mesorhizobium sp. LCM 4577]|nr:hypothetical protein LCM4577_32355 [Mesorhizobium sp. LCM 4577]